MTSTEWDQHLAEWKARVYAPAVEQKTGESPWWQAWLRGNESSLGLGTTLVEPLTQSSWVYACVTSIARQVSAIPFRIVTGDEDDLDVLQGGAVVDLFRRPHPMANRFQFWTLVVMWQQLRGEAFIIGLDRRDRVVDLSKAGRGQIVKLCVLNPDLMRHDVAANELNGWRYTTGSQDPNPTMYLLPEEVCHLRLPNPFDFWRGLSPLSVARLAAQTDYNAAQFMKGLMGNNADTGLIVTTDQQPSSEQITQIKAALMERRRKAGNMPPPMFLWGGSKIEKPTISNVDMQFLENRKFTRQEICAIYGVAQELLGFTEDANRSVSDAMRLSFMENRIGPYCEELEAGIEPVVQAMDATARGDFNVKGTPVMQAAQRTRWDTAVKAFGLGYPANAINKQLDLGMPQVPHGEKSFLPFSLQAIGDDGSPEVEPAPSEPQDEEAVDRVSDLLERAWEKRGKGEKGHTCGAGEEWLAATKGSVRRKRAVMRNFFVGQQGRVLAAIEAQSSKLKAQNEERAIDPNALFDLLDENERLWKRMGPLLRGDLEFGYAMIGKELGLGSIDIPPSDAIAWLNERQNRIADINETTFNDLKSTLQDGLGKGETQEELVERVKEVFGDAQERRAESIAHTETNTAINSARQEAMVDVGVERKGWQTANLEGVRATHLANEAKSEAENGIPIDQAWPNGLQYPSDPGGEPGEVINCRCFGFAVLPEKAQGSKFKAQLLSYEEFIGRRGPEAEAEEPAEEPAAVAGRRLNFVRDRRGQLVGAEMASVPNIHVTVAPGAPPEKVVERKQRRVTFIRDADGVVTGAEVTEDN